MMDLGDRMRGGVLLGMAQELARSGIEMGGRKGVGMMILGEGGMVDKGVCVSTMAVIFGLCLYGFVGAGMVVVYHDGGKCFLCR